MSASARSQVKVRLARSISQMPMPDVDSASSRRCDRVSTACLASLRCGDVGVGAEHAHRLAVFVPFHRPAAAGDPDPPAVEATLPVLERHDATCTVPVVVVEAAHALDVVRVDPQLPAFVYLLRLAVERQAAHALPAIGVEAGAVARVDLPDAVAGCLDGEAPGALAPRHAVVTRRDGINIGDLQGPAGAAGRQEGQAAEGRAVAAPQRHRLARFQ